MKTIKCNNAQIAYSDSEVGDPVVMIHCSSASGDEWQSLRQSLGQAFRTIAPDQWGCGKSDPWPGCGPFSLSREAAPIFDILRSIDGPVHLLGHSYGGGVALRAAHEWPYKFKSLTLVEPSCFHLLRQGSHADQLLFREIEHVAANVKQAISVGDHGGGMCSFFDYWNGKGTWNSLPHETRLKMSLRLGKVMLDFRALFYEAAGLADYAELPHPTLFVCGDCSPGPSRRIVELLAATMPHAVTARIPGAKHMSPLTHPDAVNAAITQHLLRNQSSVLQHAA